jgi:transcription termination/antitermination protein NusG
MASLLCSGLALADGAGIFEISGLWHILHTRSRQEKALADDLTALGIPCYLPLVRHVRFHGGRKAIVELPLFPGYLFLRGAAEDAYRADRTKRVAQILKVNDQDQIEWELRNLHLALAQDAPLAAYPALRKGVRVEVTGGPLRGLQGIVEERGNRDRIILQILMLGQAVSVEIEGSLLQVID